MYIYFNTLLVLAIVLLGVPIALMKFVEHRRIARACQNDVAYLLRASSACLVMESKLKALSASEPMWDALRSHRPHDIMSGFIPKTQPELNRASRDMYTYFGNLETILRLHEKKS